MRNLRQLCASFALTLVLAISAFAGQIDTGLLPPPPPGAAISGQIDTGSAQNGAITANTDNLVAVTALSVLQSVLALF